MALDTSNPSQRDELRRKTHSEYRWHYPMDLGLKMNKGENKQTARIHLLCSLTVDNTMWPVALHACSHVSTPHHIPNMMGCILKLRAT